MSRPINFMKLLDMNEEEIIGAVISLRREIMTSIFLLPTERPDFGPSQVRSVEDLIVGRQYIQHNAVGASEFIFEGLATNGWLKQHSLRFGRTTEMPQTDAGLARYEFGGWNDTNWIEDPSKKGVA